VREANNLMAAGLVWTKNPVDAWMPAVEQMPSALVTVVKEVFRAREQEITAWMKENHPFRNRTGFAEASLHTEIIEEGFIVSLVCMYTIPIFYSRYLEASKWGVLGITLDHWSPVLIADLKKVLEG